MRKITGIFLLFLIPVTYAQWKTIDDVYSPYIYSVYAHGDNIYAGADDTLYISNDKGISWHPVKITNSTQSAIYAAVKKDNILYAGISGNGVFKSNDNGLTWEPYSHGLGGWSLNAHSFHLTGDTLFMGTDGNGMHKRVLSSVDSWKPYNEGIFLDISSGANDFGITSQNYIYSGGSNPYYYLRDKGSQQWSGREFLLQDSTKAIPYIFLSVNDTVFAGTSRGIFISTDYGLTWIYSGIQAMGHTDLVKLRYFKNRIYAAFSRIGDFWVWYSEDMGKTWNILDHQLEEMLDMFIYDDIIWAGTAGGLMYSNPLTSVPGDNILPNEYMLEQNYPNPFNPVTNFKFRISDPEFVSLKIFDVLGNEISTVISEDMPYGEYTRTFDASHFASGVYYYRLTAGNFTSTKKMMVLK